MTDISATAFFRQAGEGPLGGIDFEHEEIDTGGSKRPTKIHLHAVDPDSGDRMGTLTYHVPRRKADKILVEHLGTEEDHRGKGVASALMDEMQTRHPGTPIDHGDRTDAGKGWWEKYTDGKKVTRGRTMAALTRTAAVEDGDDVPSRLLNPHGHHIRAKIGNYRNVEMVPRDEIARYASQETDPEHAKAVGHHLASSGEMEPLLLHYHPASGEAYLGEGNHRLRAARPLQMDHLPVRVQRNNYGLPGPGVKVPQDHPGLATGEHIPHDIKPSDIGLTTVDKPTMSEADKHTELLNYRLLHGSKTAAEKPCPCCGGTGEHDTCFECYHCDGGRTVAADSPDDAACDGRLPDGGHGKTASADTTCPQCGLPKREHEDEEGVDLGECEYANHITDWSKHQASMPPTMHRGVHTTLPSDLHEAVHDPDRSTEERADLLRHHLDTAFGASSHRSGMHWTTRPAVAEEFASGTHNDTPRRGDAERSTHVIVHAATPTDFGPHGPVETDPWALAHHGVFSYSPDHEAEIPLKRGAQVHVTGVSWRHGASGGWTHHTYHQPVPAKVASADTPVPDNHEPYEHKHDWLPRDHFFAPGEKGLDPRLFDENERMHPEVRQHILGLLDSFWAPKYGDSWQSWARVYLAGSEASHWYGNNDLDVLIGINHEALNHHVDAFCGEPDKVVDDKLTDELRHGLNDDARMLPGPDGKETGPWESTFFVNPDSYDIRDIKPYAAYDITADEWAVKPVEVPNDFGPEKLPESTWDVFEAIQKLIKAIRELPEGVREREGSALYDYLHADRHSAFGPDGTGLYDPANSVWKALDKAPGKPLQQLIDWKHAHDGATANDQENAA